MSEARRELDEEMNAPGKQFIEELTPILSQTAEEYWDDLDAAFSVACAANSPDVFTVDVEWLAHVLRRNANVPANDVSEEDLVSANVPGDLDVHFARNDRAVVFAAGGGKAIGSFG